MDEPSKRQQHEKSTEDVESTVYLDRMKTQEQVRHKDDDES